MRCIDCGKEAPDEGALIPEGWVHLVGGRVQCPDHIEAPVYGEQLHQRLGQALNEEQIGELPALAFDDPKSHPAVLRMLAKRLDALQGKLEAHELAGVLMSGAPIERTEAERILMAEEMEAEERQEFLDEMTQILYSGAVLGHLDSAITGRDKQTAARKGERCYELAAVLWEVRQKRIADDHLRAEFGRGRRHSAVVIDDPIRDPAQRTQNDELVKPAPFTCECGCHVFVPWYGSEEPNGEFFRCKSCNTGHQVEGGVEQRQLGEYIFPDRSKVRRLDAN
jgi:hypothetical protein